MSDWAGTPRVFRFWGHNFVSYLSCNPRAEEFLCHACGFVAARYPGVMESHIKQRLRCKKDGVRVEMHCGSAHHRFIYKPAPTKQRHA